jgi:hypothetical protein
LEHECEDLGPELERDEFERRLRVQGFQDKSDAGQPVGPILASVFFREQLDAFERSPARSDRA